MGGNRIMAGRKPSRAERKKATEAAVVKTAAVEKKAGEAVKDTAETVKETAGEKAAAVKEAVEVKAEETVETVKETVKEAAETVKDTAKEAVAAAKKTAGTAKRSVGRPKKDPADKAVKEKAQEKVQEVFLQYSDDFGQKEANLDEVVARVKAAWVADGHRESSIKSLQVYVKPQEYKAYYVINGKVNGDVDLF